MFNPGVFTPFYPLFLAHQGFDPASVGLILALGGPARVIANPLMLWLIDAGAPTRAMLCALHAGAGATLFLAIFVSGFWSMAALLFVATFLHSPSVAIIDAATTRAIQHDPSLAYGRVRVWGSVAFVIANLVGGYVVARYSPVAAAWLLVAGMSAAVVLSLLAPRDDPHKPDARFGAATTTSAVTGALALTVLASALIQASHSGYYAFSSIHWAARGYSGNLIGALWVVGVVVEIVLFARIGLLPRRLNGALAMMAIGGGAAVIRWLGMSFDPPLWITVFLQAGHALTYGLTNIGAIAAFSILSPAPFRGRTQGAHAAAFALLNGVGMYLGGIAYEHSGAGAYAWMSAVAATGLLCLIVAKRAAPQPQSALSGG